MPRKNRTHRSTDINVCIRLSPEAVEALDAAAKTWNRSKSSIVDDLLRVSLTEDTMRQARVAELRRELAALEI